MGWFEKIFGGPSHRVSEEQYYGRDSGDRSWNQQSMDLVPGYETEDLDRAIALSLVEEQRRKKEDDKRHHLEEDEKLARALQESLNAESRPRSNGQSYLPLPFLPSSGFRTCAGCNIGIGNGRFLSCMGSIWHPECFCCHACNRPINDYEFSMSANHPYHKSCYREQHHPKCDVCKDFPKDAQYVSLDDGRKLCLECLDSAIMDTTECQPLLHEILEFYEGLNMRVLQQIPLLLVERQALNEARDGEKKGHYHLPETRGLCLSEERTISTVRRRPKSGFGRKAIDLIIEPYHLTSHCEVTAILILYGLPRLLTGSILAHEMMHAWLRLQGFRNLSQQVEEGICQVLAHMWLESEITSGSRSNMASSSSSHRVGKKGPRSQFDKKLGEFFRCQIEVDTSEAYGDGFRAGHRAVVKFGLRQTLDHIRLTGNFPL